MRVIEVGAFGGPEVLRSAERPDPEPGPGEVVVRIVATDVNPTDLAARAGHYPPSLSLQPPFVPGWDLAGEVVAIGDGVGGFRPGDRVVGMIPWTRIGGRVGAYAQAAAVDPAWLAPAPDVLDDATGATVPLNALTAHQALELLDAPPESTLLVTGASGAVGGYAVQLAAQAGHRVLALASTGDEDWVASLGAAEVLARGTDLAGIGPVDGVVDAIPLGPSAAAALRDGGAAIFTRPAGAEPDRDVRFETVLVRSDAAVLEQLADDVAAGRLRTRIDRVLALEDAGLAHELNEAHGLRGKVVLQP